MHFVDIAWTIIYHKCENAKKIGSAYAKPIKTVLHIAERKEQRNGAGILIIALEKVGIDAVVVLRVLAKKRDSGFYVTGANGIDQRFVLLEVHDCPFNAMIRVFGQLNEDQPNLLINHLLLVKQTGVP